MESSILILVIIFLCVFAIKIYPILAKTNKGRTKSERTKEVYQYTRKKYFMTQSESGFMQLLFSELESEYRVFPQVHLSKIVDHKVQKQNWKAAFSHINSKSVDFVICSKNDYTPLLAIELDDWSRDSEKAKLNDAEKDRILQNAGLPLLRIREWRETPKEEIVQTIISELQNHQI